MKPTTHNLAFIVEDNEMFSTMLSHMLSNDNVCRFIGFKSGEECVSNLYMNPLVVVLDYGLPGMDGLKTFQEIKKYNPDLPIVVLTSTNDQNVARNFFNEGAHAFLVKQKSTAPEIIKIIKNLLDDSIGKRMPYNSSAGVGSILMFVLLLITLSITVFCFLYL